MKMKPLPKPVPVRAAMPMGGWQSCLPPIRRNPPKLKPQPGPAYAIGEGLLRARGPIRVLSVDHDDDWYDQAYCDEQFGEPSTKALDNLSDAELLEVGKVVELLKRHDWYYSFSDDLEVFRHGKASEAAINIALAALPFDQAAALWLLYAPAAFGSYRRP